MRNYLNYAHRLIELPAHCDSRGTLVSVESIDDVPFPIKRLYYIYGVDSAVRRGFHAHKNLEQVLVCVSGSCKVHVDDGTEQKDYDLSNPESKSITK